MGRNVQYREREEVFLFSFSLSTVFFLNFVFFVSLSTRNSKCIKTMCNCVVLINKLQIVFALHFDRQMSMNKQLFLFCVVGEVCLFFEMVCETLYQRCRICLRAQATAWGKFFKNILPLGESFLFSGTFCISALHVQHNVFQKSLISN